VDNPTLKRFFILHFLIPFIIAVVSIIHILYLHKQGSSNPLGVDSIDIVTFYPKYIIKDTFGFVIFYGLSLIFLVFYYPNLLGHPDNYIMANALVTPKHITPE
jgi:ubiquinol-cytochrome c reductase cytochrome b subunit